MIRAWHHFSWAAQSPLPKRELIEVLASADISTYALDPTAPQGPGVIFFDEVTQPLCDLLREVSRNSLERVLLIAASHSPLAGGSVWRLLRAGASDVLAWQHASSLASEVAARFARWDAIDRLVTSPLVRNSLVGHSPTWISVLRQIVEVARFTDASLLIMGESGTGKELMARLIHTLDQRPNKRDLVVVDCTTIVPELSGSEFFGHERGAFTGAIFPRDGAFALANGGTLFLDEVGELPLPLQAQLLRVVQERTYKRVGGNTWHNTEFRLVCATNKNLLQLVTRGEFRHDLYHRIAGWTFTLPPLRERTQEILPLVRHFMQQLQPNPTEEPPELDGPVREYLLTREYPGNVRDLKQLISRILHRHVGRGPITVGSLPAEERPSADFRLMDWRDEAFERAIRRAIDLGVRLKEISRAVENTAVHIAVSDDDGNLQRAARRLGVTDRALQMRRAARRQHEQAQDADRAS